MARTKHLAWPGPAVTFTLALAVAWALVWGPMPLIDDGFAMQGAWRLLQGERLYEDFHTLQMPGSFYWLAGGMALLGVGKPAALLATLVLAAVSITGSMWLARQIGATPAQTLAATVLWTALLCGDLPLNHNVHSAALVVPALAVFLQALRSGRVLIYALSGLAMAGVALFTQTKGVALLAAATPITLWWATGRRIPALGALLAGFCALILATTLPLGPVTVFRETVLWPLAHYGAVNEVSPGILVATVTATLAIFGVTLTRGGLDQPARRQGLALLGLQLALHASALNRPDLWHVLWASPVLVVWTTRHWRTLARAMVDPLRGRSHGWRPTIRGLVAAAACATLALQLLTWSLISATKLVASPSLFGSSRYQAHPGVAALRDCLGADARGLLAYPYYPLAAFLLRIEEGYPHFVLLEGMNTPAEFEQQLAVLREHAPRFVLTSYVLAESFGPMRRDTVIDAYLAQHYRPASRCREAARDLDHRLGLLERRDPRTQDTLH